MTECTSKNAPDNTGEQQGRWIPGHSGNPSGRPKGSRNKLSEAFLQVLADDFDLHGQGVVEKVRTERPHDYLKIVASIMPKQMELEEVRRSARRAEDMTDDELVAVIDELEAQIRSA
jgi:Family of unknown function (DUF5681)